MTFKSISRPFMFAALSSTALCGVGGYIWHEQARPAVLEMYLFQLKGFPIMFIRTPEDKRILINGGANSEVVRQITQILPFYSRRIDMLIATKDDLDHVAGLVDVISRYSIDTVYIPAVTLKSIGLASSTDAAYQAFLNKLDEIKIVRQQLKTGDSVSLDSKVALNVLFPDDSNSFAYSKASAPEVLFQVNYGSTSVIFMGNATTKIQRYVASTSGEVLKEGSSRVLVIPQSIAPGNVAPRLVEAINPDYLIYSQALPKSSSKPTKILPKKRIEDPLESIQSGSRFNLREFGGAKIVSDGKTIQIKNAL
jgi:beta-lactamase superfamily II metal-dependent hydrolase